MVFLNDTKFKVVRHTAFEDAVADLHLTSNKSKLLDGKSIDTSFIRPEEFTGEQLSLVSGKDTLGKDLSVMVIELEEL